MGTQSLKLDPKLNGKVNGKTTLDKVVPFIFGGASGMFSTCFIQPIDMIKVRIQLKSELLGKGSHVSPFGIFREMMASGKGFR